MRETLLCGSAMCLFIVTFYAILWLATHPVSGQSMTYYLPGQGGWYNGFRVNSYNDYIYSNYLQQVGASSVKLQAGTQKLVPVGQNKTLVVTFGNAENITSKLTPLETKIAQVFLSNQNDSLSNILTDLIGKFTLTTYSSLFEDELYSMSNLLAQEDTYQFIPQKNVSGNLVSIRIKTNRTSKMVIKPTLGALQAKGKDEYLVCTENSWEDSVEDSFPTKIVQRNCKNIGACCWGTEHIIDAEDLNFPNLYTTSPKGSEFIFITYHTSYLSFFVNNCELVIDVAGCVMHTFIADKTNYQMMSGNITFPIAHLIIPKTEKNRECTLTLCGLTKSERIHGIGWKTKEHVVHVRPFHNIKRKEDNIITKRKLLSVPQEPVPVVGYKWPVKCNTKNQMIPFKRSMLHHHLRSVAGKRITYCNGSIITDLPLTELHGCYQVADKRSYFQCPGLKENIKSKTERVNCTIEPKIQRCDSGYCMTLKMNGTGFVTTRGRGWSKTQKCSESCNIELDKKEDTQVTCPDGSVHKLFLNKIDVDCPFSDRFGGMTLYVCRATSRPRLFYIFVFWIIMGFPLLYFTFTAARLITFIFSKSIIFLKRKADRKKGTCLHCNCYVNSVYEWQRHKGCNIGECPFCKKRFSVLGLQQHASVCLDKCEVMGKDEDIVNEILLPKLLLWTGTILSKARRGTSKVIWIFLIIILFSFLIQPVRSIEDVNLQSGEWEDEMKEVEICTDNCLFLEDHCLCPSAVHRRNKRELLSEKMTETTAAYYADVQAPWGSVHIEGTHKPKYSENSIKMSWTSAEYEETGKLKLNGRAEAILKLEPRSGLTFELSSEKALEKRMLVINLIDFTQVYKTRFEYLTGDRKIGDWMHGTCSGDCPEKCGCDTPTCLNTKWMNSRNWHCNPTWCWRMDAGCTCCGTDVIEPFDKFLLSKWKVEYTGTAYIICVEFSKDKRTCDVVSDGTVFEHGPFKIQLSEVSNIQKKLPDEISLVHSISSDGSFDLLSVKEVISSENLCKLESCAHGGAGDYQIFDLRSITGNNIDNEHFLAPKEQLKKIKHSWMSWNGVVQRYTCSVGHWPDCSSSGVVVKNTDAFNNLLTTSENYTSDYYFHALHTSLGASIPSLELEGRPHKGGGVIEIMLEVDGLILEPKDAIISRLDINVHECTGCFGCIVGVTCRGTVLLEGVDDLNVHLRSMTEHFDISHASFPVHTHNLTTFEIKGFSPIKIPRICLEVEEGRNCKTCPQPVTSCTSVTLSPPKEIMLEHRSTLKSTQVDKCGSAFSCWISGASNFFKNVSHLFGNFFGKYITSIIILGMLIITAVLIVFLGSKVFFCLKYCKKGRAIIKNSQKISQNEGILGLSKHFLSSKDLDPDDMRVLLRKSKVN
ncbi:glycoprotein precursor [Zirqa virus]|uniref:M polyprotein n=1 Tax=Zirqa virus TaxID=1810947 RepID=A0A191KWE4_9VIRU|nr:glycoprotein precursor [Zirqa virus]AMT75438.1 glycoprotein precursor [Zirqa virus]